MLYGIKVDGEREYVGVPESVSRTYRPFGVGKGLIPPMLHGFCTDAHHSVIWHYPWHELPARAECSPW